MGSEILSNIVGDATEQPKFVDSILEVRSWTDVRPPLSLEGSFSDKAQSCQPCGLLVNPEVVARGRSRPSVCRRNTSRTCCFLTVFAIELLLMPLHDHRKSTAAP